MGNFFKEKFGALILSVMLHVLLVAFLFIKIFPAKMVLPPASAPPLKAKILNNKEVQKYAEEIRKEEQRVRDNIKKQKELEELARKQKRDQEKTSKRIEKQKKDKIKRQREKKKREALAKKERAEEKKREKARKRQLEERRKKAAEQKREKAKQDEIARKKKRKADAKKRKLQEAKRKKAEKKRKAAAKKKAERRARRLAEKKRIDEDRQRQLDAEEKRMRDEKSRETSLLQRSWFASITSKVSRNWARPTNVQGEVVCRAYVRITRGGTILEARVESCTGGDDLLKRSVQTAIIKSDPLPKPDSPEIFVSEFYFDFVDKPK